MDKKLKHGKRIRISRLLIAAAVIILSISVGVTAYAKVTKTSISDVFVRMFSDYATIDYSNKNNDVQNISDSENNSALYKELKEGGIESISLPTELYSAEYEKIDWISDFSGTTAIFIAELDGDKMVVNIESFADKKWIMNPNIQGEFTASKKLDVNGVEVYLFEREGDSPRSATTSISYQIGLTQYFIDCPYTIERAEHLVSNMG